MFGKTFKHLSTAALAKFCSSFLVILLVLAGLGGAAARAQEFRGTISGSVTDSAGAIVSGAKITVAETQTGTQNHTVSDKAGQYVVPFLLPGDYTITVSAPGFEKTIHSGITLQSQEHPIVNLTLPIGVASDTVTVTSAPPLIDEANASIGQVISTESVADLPLNGRTPTTLTELSAGVISTAPPQLVHPFDNNAGNSWSIGGTPNQVSEVLLDGSPDLTLLGALAYAPTQDTVQEVSIRPFDTDASTGHTIGGVVNQITKSGTNRLHGTVYEFNQIPNLDGNLYINSQTVNPKTGVAPLPLAVTHYNQWGLTVGGPIFAPKVFNGKDKLFFFFAYEGVKDSQPTPITTTVPTGTGVAGSATATGERGGDFSALLTPGCVTAANPTGAYTTVNNVATCTGGTADTNQLYNPFTATGTSSSWTRSPILNNNLNSVGQAYNSIALAYMNLFPVANTTGSTTGANNYNSNAPSIDKYNNEFGRLDYNASARDHIYFDIRHNKRTQTKNDYFGNGITGTTLLRENFGTTVDNVFTLNSTTIVDTRVNWTFFNESHGTQGQQYNPTTLGFGSNIAGSSNEVMLPYINFSGGSCTSGTSSGASFQCLGDTASAIDPTTSYQVFVDIVKIIGAHSLKFGFDGRQYRLSVQNLGAASGSYTIADNFVESKSGGNAQAFGGDLASFMFGLPTSGSYDLNARSDYHQYYTGSFIQDDWRVNQHLTVNLGLRFDIDTPFREKSGHTVNGFDPTATNTATAPALAAFTPQTVSSGTQTATISSINANGGLTFPSSNNGAVYQTNKGFLSPRVGFSYSQNNKLVYRGGIGFFVQPETLASLASTGTYSSNALTNSEGFSATTSYLSTTNNYLTSANTLSTAFSTGFAQPTGSSLGASTFLGQAIPFLAPKQHDAYSERWNFGVQYSLTNSTLLEALYVGNHSLHLPIAQQNLNAIEKQYLTTNPYYNASLKAAYAVTVTNPFAGLLPNATASNTNSAKTPFSNLIVPYPQFGTQNVYEQNQTIGQSYFNSGILHFEQRSKHGLTLTANYSFSKMTEADTFLNDEDTTPTHRISPFDHTHHFTVGGTYNLPFGKGKMFAFGGSKLWDEIVGGFVLNGVYQYQSGQPIVFGSDLALLPGVNIRQISNQPRHFTTSSINSPSLSTNLFATGSSAPTTAVDGTTYTGDTYGVLYDHYRTLPQTMSWVRQDGFNNMDLSVLKNFNFTKGAFLQLRLETFNTLNHPVFAAPGVATSNITNKTFGDTTAVISNSLPRQVQLGARIVF